MELENLLKQVQSIVGFFQGDYIMKMDKVAGSKNDELKSMHTVANEYKNCEVLDAYNEIMSTNNKKK